MVTPDFTRYYNYQELTDLLKSYEIEFPHLVRLSSIGESHEGREILMATITNFETGDAEDKPGFWIDGNIHATEVSASTAAIKIIHLLTSSQSELLNSRVFYIVPRLNPDGAEWALSDPPKFVRSGTRPYPFDEEDPYGLEKQDVDGDGRMLTMRIPDSNGAWKISEEEPRLLCRREPGEFGGKYYRLVAEGLFHHFDGLTMKSQKIKEGLDFNRNFPSGWRPENEQHGAGPFPTSEPEIRAAVKAITDRPNICGGITFHTFSGVILRIPGRYPDDQLPPEDLWTMQELGKKGTELSGYPCISVFHDFKYHPKDSITGVFDDWLYDHCGIYGWTVEIWSPQRQAGITDYKYIDWFRDHPIEDDIKMLKWSDEKLGGKGYVEWKEFDHPQLGKVEIGGWDTAYAFRNPPPEYLDSEISPLADWAIWMAATIPCLEQKDLELQNLGDNTRIRIAIQNTGYLPTNVTERAAQNRIVRGVTAEIFCESDDSESIGNPSPTWLVSGSLRQIGPQLKGRSHIPKSTFGGNFDSTDDITVFEWIVQNGQNYTLDIKHQRAGRVTTEIHL